MPDFQAAARPPSVAERLISLERDVRNLLSWTEEHGKEKMEDARGLQEQLAGLRTEVSALRSDILMAKGATRAAGVIASAVLVLIGAVWSLIQFLTAHIPLK